MDRNVCLCSEHARDTVSANKLSVPRGNRTVSEQKRSHQVGKAISCIYTLFISITCNAW